MISNSQVIQTNQKAIIIWGKVQKVESVNFGYNNTKKVMITLNYGRNPNWNGESNKDKMLFITLYCFDNDTQPQNELSMAKQLELLPEGFKIAFLGELKLEKWIDKNTGEERKKDTIQIFMPLSELKLEKRVDNDNTDYGHFNE